MVAVTWHGRHHPILLIEKFLILKNKLFPPPERGPWVRIEELRQWLDHCDNHHSGHYQFSTQSGQVFIYRPKWLIDVCCHSLVPAQSHHRYVALSYLWGPVTPLQARKSNIEELQRKGSLIFGNTSASEDKAPSAPGVASKTVRNLDLGHELSTLPQTVRDAMVITQKLEEQFLWVDSLCILQDDDEEKRDNLRHTGSIYANAYVTIVAATGNASQGLRGIEHTTPPMERIAEALMHLRTQWMLRLELEKHHKDLHASEWNHRAWTFQEQLFSRRLLIFGNKGAI